MPSPINTSIIGQREKFLLYGDPGMGKTFCALTAPGPIYFLSVGAHNEAKTYYANQFQEKYRKRLPEKDLFLDVVVEDFRGMTGYGKDTAVGFDRAKECIEKAFEADDKGEIHFETIVIDNATVLTEYQVNKAIAMQSGKGETLSKLQKDDILTVADFEWKDVQNMMGKFLSELFAVDKHVVFVAHEWEQTVTNRATQTADVIAIKPLFIGKQRDRVANTFDNVWRFTQEAKSFVARTTPRSQSPSIVAKTRVGGVIDPDYMNPDLTEVIERFKKHAEKMSKLSNVTNS